MSFLVISTSLRDQSQSRLLADAVMERFADSGVDAELIDMRHYPLPFCDAGDCYAHPNVATLRDKIANASAIVLATPVYNYSASATAKNLIELTGQAWREKVVGFLCAAGGQSSYMAIMGIANSLMLDFRCLIVPRFVYISERDAAFDDPNDPEISRRLDELAALIPRLAVAVDQPR